MRVVFIGASLFGKECLNSMLHMPDIELVGVVTAPRDFSISYNKQGVTNVLHADIGEICDNLNIPVSEIKDGMKGDDLFNTVKSWQADIMIVAGWYHMIPKKWRDMAPTYGLHASLLPDYSGGAPLVWAMINGEKETGITFFQFDDGVDNGPIVGQKRTPINEDDTIATLYARIEKLGLALLKDYLPKLANGTAELIEQDESKRRLVPQRKPEDGEINFLWDAEKIHNFIRAQTKPYPGAFFSFNDYNISIWESSICKPDECIATEAGHVTNDGNSLFLGCSNSTALKITNLAVDGEDLSVIDFINRFNFRKEVKKNV